MKTQKLKVTLNEIKRMKELAGISNLNESKLNTNEARSVKLKANPNTSNLVDFIVPDWSLPAIINGDISHLDDEEEQKINNFLKMVSSKYGNALFLLGDENDDDLGFRRSNDIDSLGANTHRVYIIPSK